MRYINRRFTLHLRSITIITVPRGYRLITCWRVCTQRDWEVCSKSHVDAIVKVADRCEMERDVTGGPRRRHGGVAR